jgi:GT2 family glycosyltransferase
MKIFSIICTRDKDLSPITSKLVHTLSSYGVSVKLLVNQKSIFEAYKKGLTSCDAKEEDIIIYCHDDLEIKTPYTEFILALAKCTMKETGIVGPAGTTFLGRDAVWWNQENWQSGYHRGLVSHINKENGEIYGTHYGPHGQVVALDGLFLAARKEVWEAVGVEKPQYFKGEWDFYDIHYTTKSHSLGYKNYTVPIDLIHHSGGELVGRDSWHKNRESFIKNTRLPLKIQ